MDATTLTSPGPAARPPATPADAVVDARPILRRTEHNPWDRTEQVRSRLYRLVEATCRKLGFEALVLESDPYVHPAWVKVESWKPACNGALTMRSAMTVTIAAVPYHRYETLYSVKWEKLGRCGSVDHLYAFGEREIRQMMHFLWAAPSVGFVGDEVESILSPVQLRTEWWQLWRPRNKPAALRKDWLQIGAGWLILTGILLLMVGCFQTAELQYDASYVEEDTTAVLLPLDTMTVAPSGDRVGPAVPADTVTTVLVDTPAAVTPEPTESVIHARSDVTGRLDDLDPTFNVSGAPFDLWTYYGRAGERIVVTLQSSAFPLSLELGQTGAEQWVSLATGNTSNDLLRSQLEMTVPVDGAYHIVVASRDPALRGDYTLRVDN